MTNLNYSQLNKDKCKLMRFKEVKRGGGSIVYVKPAFSHDSKKILLASGNDVLVYNVKGGKLLQQLKGHQRKVIDLFLHPENKNVFVSCDEGGNIIQWSSNPTKIIQKSKLNISPGNQVVTFKAGPALESALALYKNGDLVLFKSPFSNATPKTVSVSVHIGSNKVALSACGEYCVAIKDKFLLVKDCINFNNTMKHRVGKIQLQCVALHPTQEVAATGDALGRIIIWHNIFNPRSSKMTLHWHTMPVMDLVFSHLGNEVYSGGKESVIVKWQLTEGRRYFLPRVGMPISLLAADSTNSYVASAQGDNSISIVDGKEWSRLGVIQGFSTNLLESPFPCGLTLHPSTNTVITNANCGQLQFYDIEQERQIYQLDVTNRNYITEERNNKIPNIDVVHVGLSTFGNWLVTFETECPPNVVSHEYRLKFWLFDTKNQTWILNTSVEMPHNVLIGGLDVQSTLDQDDYPMCVTYTPNGRFKIWQIVDDTDIYRENVCWNCVHSGDYQGLPLQTAKFTPDGSMLGLAFGSTLTMWLPETCDLRGSLSQPYLTESIKQIVFGNGDGNLHLVVTRSDNWLCCWNLLTCCLSWRVYVNCTHLVGEPSTGLVVGFTQQRDVFMFEHKKCEPIVWQKEAVSSVVDRAIFVPCKAGKSFMGTSSSLCYLDNDTRLLNTLEMIVDEDLCEDMDIDAQDSVIQLEKEPDEELQTKNILTIKPKSKKKEKNKSKDIKEIPRDSESEKFLSKFLSDLTVHHMDTFGSLAKEFCNLVIPDCHISEPTMETHMNTNYERQPPISKLEKKPEKLAKVSKSFFDEIVGDIL